MLENKNALYIEFANKEVWQFAGTSATIFNSTPFHVANNGRANYKVKPYALMAIVNLTPDSFYDGNRFTAEKNINKSDDSFFLSVIEKLIDDGADILDLGGESSRPGAEPVSFAEEKQRVIPKLQLIKKHFPKVKVSIDTTKGEIAEIGCKEGADIINDISAGIVSKDKIFHVASKHQVPIIIMHMRGTPKTMQNSLEYKNGVLHELEIFFEERLAALYKEKIAKNKIILDVGIGFGKSLQQNLELLQHQERFLRFGFPLLLGASMKSMHQQLVGAALEERLSSTLAVHLAGLQNGASLLRVHNVRAAKQFLTAYFSVKTNENYH